jgi:hypothetical protein
MPVQKNIKLFFFVCLVITFLVIWKYYWRLQLNFNSSIHSFFTPESFEIPKNLEETYEKKVNQGKEFAKTQKVVIAALVRDVKDKIPDIIKKSEKMGSIFQDYHILIVENDSKDGTREELLEWSSLNPKVTILGCGYNASVCSIPNTPKTDGHSVDRSRIEKMVTLRNIYLDEIKKNFSTWDFSIFWDLDTTGSVYIDGVWNTFGYLQDQKDLNVVCSYGIYRWGALTLFYDSYAYLWPNEKFHINLKTIHDIRKGLWEVQYNRGEDLVECDSCFSGFAIYRISPILPSNVIYDMSDESNLECEHVRLNMKIKGKKMINPSMINLVLENS